MLKQLLLPLLLSASIISTGYYGESDPHSYTTLTLHISENDTLQDLQHFDQLMVLELTGHVPSDLTILQSLPALQYLTIHSDSLQDASALAGLTNLLVLDLSHSALRALPDISVLTQLLQLDVSYNTISTWNEALLPPSLLAVDLRMNALDEKELASLAAYYAVSPQRAQLRALTVQGNKMDMTAKQWAAHASQRDIVLSLYAVNSTGTELWQHTESGDVLLFSGMAQDIPLTLQAQDTTYFIDVSGVETVRYTLHVIYKAPSFTKKPTRPVQTTAQTMTQAPTITSTAPQQTAPFVTETTAITTSEAIASLSTYNEVTTTSNSTKVTSDTTMKTKAAIVQASVTTAVPTSKTQLLTQPSTKANQSGNGNAFPFGILLFLLAICASGWYITRIRKTQDKS